MSITFQGLIAHNKRVSWALILILGVFCATFSGIFFTAVTGGGQYWHIPFLIGSALGAVATLIGTGVSYFWGASIITSISHARKVDRDVDPQLVNIVEEIAIAAGIPCPEVYIMDDPSPNAFATGRDPEHALVCVTTGLREKLNREELQAVIAHEIGHIKNYDTRIMMLVAVFAGIIVLLADMFTRSMRIAATDDDDRKSWAMSIFFVLIGLVLSLIAPFIAKLLQLAVSREREYLADATAVQLARNPEGLVSALRKIASDTNELLYRNKATEHMFIMNPDPRQRFLNFEKDSIWSTHPPLSKRIQRLRQLQGMHGGN